MMPAITIRRVLLLTCAICCLMYVQLFSKTFKKLQTTAAAPRPAVSQNARTVAAGNAVTGQSAQKAGDNALIQQLKISHASQRAARKTKAAVDAAAALEKLQQRAESTDDAHSSGRSSKSPETVVMMNDPAVRRGDQQKEAASDAKERSSSSLQAPDAVLSNTQTPAVGDPQKSAIAESAPNHETTTTTSPDAVSLNNLTPAIRGVQQKAVQSPADNAPPTEQETAINSTFVAGKTTLASFFQLLCKHKVTHCCRNESRLDVLDELALTLGAVQSYPQPGAPIPIAEPSPKEKELQCHRYQFEARSGPITYNTTKQRMTVNNFHGRRLVYIVPTVQEELLQPIFSGPIKDEPRVIVDILMVNNELDVLQARMYELNAYVDYFVIIESSYNHRGWKKYRFVQQEMTSGTRYQAFRQKIIYVDIDACPEYMMEVVKERNSNGTQPFSVGTNVWPIQETMRSCVWPSLKDSVQKLPNSTLVLMSDLDWLPCSGTLRDLKYCQPSDDYGGLDANFRIGLKHDLRTSLLRSEPRENLLNEHFAILPLGRIRETNFLPLRGYASGTAKEHYIIQHPIVCGIHLQLMGSLPHLVYREVTHAEGSTLNKLLKVLDGQTDYCQMNDTFWRAQQEKMTLHPEYFHWNHMVAHQKYEPLNVTVAGGNGPPITEERIQAMRDAHVPAVLFDHWQQFPFFWGLGDYDMYIKES